MKLGLLVVVAVAVLVPDPSESLTVSRCTLRTKLREAIKLPPKLLNAMDQILAKVICNLEKNPLDTARVRVIGDPRPTTTMTTTNQTSAVGETTQTTTTQTSTTTLAARRKREANNKTIGVSEESAFEEFNDVESNEDDGADMEEEEGALEELVNEVLSELDEEAIQQADGQVAEGDSWSVGYYGIFQLSDSYYCNSGHRLTVNKCKKPCSSFTDEDISDDIDCLIKTQSWGIKSKSATYWNATCINRNK